MGKNQVSDPNHISESLETIFRVKNIYIVLCGSGFRNLFDPGSGMEKFGSGIKNPGSTTLECKGHRTCLGGEWGALEAFMRRKHL
jgi:hypothetical protein